jgi:glycosyltransferase involved in cell wall biosynthesis
MTRLASCILPTYNRRSFVAQAIDYFRRQDYPDRELIIVDDGTDPVEDLASHDPTIRYLRLDARQTVGAKRNLACREARGEIILHWDDDDWMADWRISYQVRRLLESGAELCGLDRLDYCEPATGKAWEYVYPPGARRWVAGNTLCYRRHCA